MAPPVADEAFSRVSPPEPFVRFTQALLGKADGGGDLEACLTADPSATATWFGAGRLSGLAVATLARDQNLNAGLRDMLFEGAESKGSGDPVREAVAAIHAYSVMQRLIRDKGLARADFGGVRHHGDALRAALRPSNDRFGDTLAIRLVDALIVSLTDRDAAAAIVEEVLTTEPRLTAALPYFVGAASFGGHRQLADMRPEKNPHVRQTIQESLDGRRPELTLVLSADARFLRHYGTTFLNLAPYLHRQGIEIVILVCGAAESVPHLIWEGRQLARGLAEFRGLRDPAAKARLTHFIPAPVPEWIVEPRTFYACARYLYASDVMEATQAPVLVMDIDMELAMEPEAFLKKARNLEIAFPFSRGLSALCPWRRCMAGTVLVKPGDAGREFLSSVEAYLSWGLARPNSWTLDQNALSYAVDMVGLDTVSEIGAAGRLFKQEKHRAMFERFF